MREAHVPIQRTQSLEWISNFFSEPTWHPVGHCHSGDLFRSWEMKLEHPRIAYFLLKREKFNFLPLSLTRWHWPLLVSRAESGVLWGARNSQRDSGTRKAARSSTSFHQHEAPCGGVMPLYKYETFWTTITSLNGLEVWKDWYKKRAGVVKNPIWGHVERETAELLP